MKNHLGLGVMINMLSGNEKTVESFKQGLNKKINSLFMKDDALHFEFEDGYKMKLWDDGQSCCESRYMMTSDDLSYFIGSILLDAEILKAPNVEDGKSYGDHEIQFLKIKTDKGVFTMETHNEHNGYYGGFYIKCSSC